MIPITHKIKRADFPPFSAKKQIWNGTSLRIFCYVGDSHEDPAFAVVVPQKKFKKHIQRTYFKRIVFESIRAHAHVFDGLVFKKFIIHPNLEVGGITFEMVNKDLVGFFEKYAA